MYLVLLKIKKKIYFESLDSQDEMMDFIDSVENKFGSIEYKKSVIISGDKLEINEILESIDERFYLHIVGRRIDEKVYKDLIRLVNELTLDVKVTIGIEFEGDECDEEIETEEAEEFPEPEPVKHTPVKEKAKPRHRPPEKEHIPPTIGIMDDVVEEEEQEEEDDYFVPPLSPIAPKTKRPEQKPRKRQFPTPKVEEIAVQTTAEFTDLSYSVFIYWFDDKVIISLDEINDNYIDSKSFSQSFENLDESISLFEGFKYDFMDIIDDENETMFIINERLETVNDFIESKISMLKWKGTKAIKYFDGKYKRKKVERQDPTMDHEYLTAKEVMKKLRISDQTLANWRRNNLIDFRKISNRKYLYLVNSVTDIFENGIDTSGVGNTPPPEKIVSAQIKQIDYKQEILNLIKPFAFKIPEYKFAKQNFFLNFGNVGMSSSPQVMINNEFQLVDYIKKSILKETPKDLYEYLIGLFDEGKEPRIDTSKKVQKEYSKFYLNKLYDKEILSK